MSDGNQSFKERNSKPNQGEELFKTYCDRIGATYYRIGFDEKRVIPTYYHLTPFLRHLPDFIVHNPKTGRLLVVEVKGSLNFKESDYLRLKESDDLYGSGEAPYYIVFALRTGIYWMRADEVAEAYEWSTTIGSWDEGRTKYRTLDL
jgi:hypothetical protein